MAAQIGSTSPSSSYLRLSPALPIPNDMALAGQTFYAQAVAVDQPNGGLARLVVSPAVEIVIGDPIPPNASQVYKTGSTTALTGRVSQGQAIALRLQ